MYKVLTLNRHHVQICVCQILSGSLERMDPERDRVRPGERSRGFSAWKNCQLESEDPKEMKTVNEND